MTTIIEGLEPVWNGGDYRPKYIDLIQDLAPLPVEKYPRVIEQRTPDRGFYIALGLVLSVWMITPLSCAYVVWYALVGRGLPGGPGLTATIFAAYALTETVFAIYHHYLVLYVQRPTPPSSLPLETRNALFLKVLHAGLAYPLPSLAPETPDSATIIEAEHLYSLGHISAIELHHARDHEYREVHGLRERSKRRVGKATEAEKRVISSFVEDEPGDRERRLREQIENDVGVGSDDQGDDERIMDDDGNPIMLDFHDRRAVEFRERLRTWFSHAPWGSIQKENVMIWLSWCTFTLPVEEARSNPTFWSFLQKSLALLEARTGTKFPEGMNPKIQVMRLTMDPVNAKGRPLILYALSNSINWWLRDVVYPSQGAGQYTEGAINYLIRIPKNWTPEKGRTHPNAMPVIYLHGLGFGLMQNHLLIKHLIKSLPTHPIVVPLAHHTGQAFFNEQHLRPWTREQLVEGIKGICRKWGFWQDPQSGQGEGGGDGVGGVSLLSHSNGSVAHAWILKDCPSLARRSTFVDPVVFCIWEGDLCHSFCYRKPTTALELLLYYFIASEVGIANYIQRNFDWAENALFIDEIPNVKDSSKTAIFLGAKDIIIDSARVRRYLERHGVRAGLHWDPEGGHGDGLAGSARDRVVMFAGTGSTKGWEGWLANGRRRHSMGEDDRVGPMGRGWSSGETTEVGGESDGTSVDVLTNDGKYRD